MMATISDNSSRRAAGEAGSVLVLTLLVCMILLGLGLTAMWLSTEGGKVSTNISRRGEAYFGAFNISTRDARTRVEDLLREEHGDVILDGHRYKAGEATLLTAHFAEDHCYVHLGFPPGPYGEACKRDGFLPILQDAEPARGDLSPGLLHGLTFLAISSIFVWVPVAALLNAEV